jgi:hypothetical protein
MADDSYCLDCHRLAAAAAHSALGTSAANVRVKNLRPAVDNLREWMAAEGNVYVGRRGVILLPDPITGKRARFPPESSPYANPFKVGRDGDLAEVLKKYKAHLAESGFDRAEVEEELAGKQLGCWCAPAPCHADVLAIWLAGIDDILCSGCR